MPSIIIPAHNEAALIESTLSTLLKGAEPGELEVIVVCNGCTDDTPDICRRFPGTIEVIETDIPSKSNALNLGDERAHSFPRFFVDADVTLPIDSIREVSRVLSGKDVLAASPSMRVDLEGRPWTVRAYYNIWMRLPYVQETMLGCGVYAVNEEGRSRFDQFPPIIADDHFIHLLFEKSEKATVSSAWFQIRSPRRLWDLIQIDVRRRVGVFELEGYLPAVQSRVSHDRVKQRKAILGILKHPRLWIQLLVYVYAKATTVVLHRLRALQNRDKEWARDESSRSE